MVRARLQHYQAIRDGLPDGRAGLSRKHVLLSVVISAELVVCEDEIISDCEVQVPVLESQRSQLMHETFNEVIGQFERELEIDSHEKKVNFLSVLLQELIEEPDELVRCIEGVVEVVFGTSVASHGQTADILCEVG